MASINIAGDTSGVVTLQAPSVAGSTTLNLPATSGTVMVNGPAFSAYSSADQSIPNVTYTKTQMNVEVFDTNGNYDQTTNYRFTPTIAGYYQINANLNFTTAAINTFGFSVLYKNGASINVGSTGTNNTAVGIVSTISTLIYMNGSTDYLELYAFQNSGGALNILNGAGTVSYFQGFLARGA
jgi:hypothetical protein